MSPSIYKFSNEFATNYFVVLKIFPDFQNFFIKHEHGVSSLKKANKRCLWNGKSVRLFSKNFFKIKKFWYWSPPSFFFLLFLELNWTSRLMYKQRFSQYVLPRLIERYHDSKSDTAKAAIMKALSYIIQIIPKQMLQSYFEKVFIVYLCISDYESFGLCFHTQYSAR